MPMVTGRSGPGYAEASIPPWGAGGGGGGAAGGGGFTGMGDLGGMADLVRQAMLQKMDQSSQGFEEWKAGRQQARQIAGAEEGRRVRGEKRSERGAKKSSRLEAEARTNAAPYQRSALERAQARDVATTQALTGRMPTRTSFGLGYIAPNQMDTSKMSGAQRAQFLPQSAGLAPSTSRMDISGLTSDMAFDSLINQNRARAMPEVYGAQQQQQQQAPAKKKKKAPPPEDDEE